MKTITLEVEDECPEGCAWLWVSPQLRTGIVTYGREELGPHDMVPTQNLVALALWGMFLKNPEAAVEYISQRKRDLGLEHPAARA